MRSPINSAISFGIYSLSEQSVTLEFGHEISEELHHQISSFDRLIHSNTFAGFKTTVPAYSTLSIFYDILEVSQSDMPGEDCFTKVSNYLHQLQSEQLTQPNTPNNSITNITIPTCYGGEYGEDIAEVAQLNNLSIDEVISLHSTAIYKVYMIGFVPGFAYLGGMDQRLATPRKPSPRKAIPAGSVGIAGEQTGIYPLETPGGWQLLGRTPIKLFDANKAQPSLLKAGDQVKFQPIDHNQFNQYHQ
ncbi:5-oxoprolinase subunit PxpB [Mucilaginibacter agri]|uniref:5-oxoprolinase subunit PxpB n=1 Tax=Mucilaginibacter agri TaxID=2695265 RepID=A0A965ZF30_9SPHI|nr:5-oxoprolinase subunit PxpB [Mucilaginibacter agri]NCD69043.1 5-oxoprolinase subunit PxpB [Mucilaginibacter agri]